MSKSAIQQRQQRQHYNKSTEKSRYKEKSKKQNDYCCFDPNCVCGGGKKKGKKCNNECCGQATKPDPCNCQCGVLDGMVHANLKRDIDINNRTDVGKLFDLPFITNDDNDRNILGLVTYQQQIDCEARCNQACPWINEDHAYEIHYPGFYEFQVSLQVKVHIPCQLRNPISVLFVLYCKDRYGGGFPLQIKKLLIPSNNTITTKARVNFDHTPRVIRDLGYITAPELVNGSVTFDDALNDKILSVSKQSSQIPKQNESKATFDWSVNQAPLVSLQSESLNPNDVSIQWNGGKKPLSDVKVEERSSLEFSLTSKDGSDVQLLGTEVKKWNEENAATDISNCNLNNLEIGKIKWKDDCKPICEISTKTTDLDLSHKWQNECKPAACVGEQSGQKLNIGERKEIDHSKTGGGHDDCEHGKDDESNCETTDFELKYEWDSKKCGKNAKPICKIESSETDIESVDVDVDNCDIQCDWDKNGKPLAYDAAQPITDINDVLQVDGTAKCDGQASVNSNPICSISTDTIRDPSINFGNNAPLVDVNTSTIDETKDISIKWKNGSGPLDTDAINTVSDLELEDKRTQWRNDRPKNFELGDDISAYVELDEKSAPHTYTEHITFTGIYYVDDNPCEFYNKHISRNKLNKKDKVSVRYCLDEYESINEDVGIVVEAQIYTQYHDLLQAPASTFSVKHISCVELSSDL